MKNQNLFGKDRLRKTVTKLAVSLKTEAKASKAYEFMTDETSTLP